MGPFIPRDGENNSKTSGSTMCRLKNNTFCGGLVGLIEGCINLRWIPSSCGRSLSVSKGFLEQLFTTDIQNTHHTVLKIWFTDSKDRKALLSR